MANNTVDAIFGGVVVGCLTDSEQMPCQAHGHSNLTIADNLIQNSAVLPLLVTSARGVSIAGNVFRCVPSGALILLDIPRMHARRCIPSLLHFVGNLYLV